MKKLVYLSIVLLLLAGCGKGKEKPKYEYGDVFTAEGGEAKAALSGNNIYFTSQDDLNNISETGSRVFFLKVSITPFVALYEEPKDFQEELYRTTDKYYVKIDDIKKTQDECNRLQKYFDEKNIKYIYDSTNNSFEMCISGDDFWNMQFDSEIFYRVSIGTAVMFDGFKKEYEKR